MQSSAPSPILQHRPIHRCGCSPGYPISPRCISLLLDKALLILLFDNPLFVLFLPQPRLLFLLGFQQPFLHQEKPQEKTMLPQRRESPPRKPFDHEFTAQDQKERSHPVFKAMVYDSAACLGLLFLFYRDHKPQSQAKQHIHLHLKGIREQELICYFLFCKKAILSPVPPTESMASDLTQLSPFPAQPTPPWASIPLVVFKGSLKSAFFWHHSLFYSLLSTCF